MHSTNLIYQADKSLHGFIAYNDEDTQQRPAILIAHDWTGRNEFACLKAEKLASLGYVGFAVDMYGNAQLGKDNDEKSSLMKPLIEDRTLLSTRINAAYDAVKKLPQVDSNKIFVMGYCFGGLCALDLARSGAKLLGAISFHGLLTAPENNSENILAKILVLHGYDDPMVPLSQVETFANEMNSKSVDWQIHMYGNTMHAFTNPLANDPKFGTVYDKQADQRSWQALCQFLNENLS